MSCGKCQTISKLRNNECMMCKNEKAVLLSQSGTTVCKECLKRRLNKKFSSALKINFKKGKSFLVGISGDDLCSQAVVHLLASQKLRNLAGLPNVQLIHIYSEDTNLNAMQNMCKRVLCPLKLININQYFHTFSSTIPDHIKKLLIKMCLYKQITSDDDAIILCSSQSKIFRDMLFKLVKNQKGIFDISDSIFKIPVVRPLASSNIRDIAAYLALHESMITPTLMSQQPIEQILNEFVIKQGSESSWASSAVKMVKKFKGYNHCSTCWSTMIPGDEQCDICQELILYNLFEDFNNIKK